MINSIDFTRLRNAEVVQFMKNINELVHLNDETTLNVTAQYNALSTQVIALESLFKLSQSSELSVEIFSIDARRDAAVTGIGLLVDAHLHHFDPALTAAAQKLQKNLAIYGSNIAKENYNTETATIRSIVNDWKEEPLLPAVNVLKLGSWVAELEEANTLFDKKYLARTQEYGAATPETMKAERVNTYQKYYDLRDRIVALYTITPTDLLKKAINEINALVEQYNTTLAMRTPEPNEPDNEAPAV